MPSIEELSYSMTKEEFMKYVDEKEICPDEFELPEFKDAEGCQEGLNLDQCHECWNKAIENITFKVSPLILFENKGMQILKALKDLEASYKALETQRDGLKVELQKAMEAYDIDKWENDEFSVTYIAASSRSSVDSKKLLKEYPDVYTNVVKESAVKASIRFKIK